MASVQVPGVGTHTLREFIDDNSLGPVVVAKAIRSKQGDLGWTLVWLIGVEPKKISQLCCARGGWLDPTLPCKGGMGGLAKKRLYLPGQVLEPEMPVCIGGLGNGCKKRICNQVGRVMPGSFSSRAVHKHMGNSLIIPMTKRATCCGGSGDPSLLLVTNNCCCRV
eukprot:2923783-Rhodomonas_salina.3